ncbi:hypothetical protein HMI54_001220 [Coelomomyces lativittatus]|nr:hypothetical protein HMI54_001220 [Coelomomyces lativittatus]
MQYAPHLSSPDSLKSGNALSGVIDNPYFSAGLGLFGVGTLAAVSRKMMLFTHEYLKRRYLVTLEIPSKDKAYQWVLHWLSKQQQPMTFQKTWSLRPKVHQWALETSFKQHDLGATTTNFAMVPGLGNHWINYNGTWIKVIRFSFFF